MSKSKVPLWSGLVRGVYGRMTGFPSSPIGPLVTTHPATGSPNVCSGESSLKRKILVL